MSALIKRGALKILSRSLCHGHPALFPDFQHSILSFQTHPTTLPLFLSQEQTKQAGPWEYEVILVTNPDCFELDWTYFDAWAQKSSGSAGLALGTPAVGTGSCWLHTLSLWENKRDKGIISRTPQWVRETSPGGKSLLIWEPFLSKKQITLMANLFLWIATCQGE